MKIPRNKAHSHPINAFTSLLNPVQSNIARTLQKWGQSGMRTTNAAIVALEHYLDLEFGAQPSALNRSFRPSNKAITRHIQTGLRKNLFVPNDQVNLFIMVIIYFSLIESQRQIWFFRSNFKSVFELPFQITKWRTSRPEDLYVWRPALKSANVIREEIEKGLIKVEPKIAKKITDRCDPDNGESSILFLHQTKEQRMILER